MAIHSIVDLVQALDNVFARKGSSGLPAGGTKGKFLRKKSATDGDAEWADPIYHYETIAQVNAAVANGDVPVGAYISCDENSPSGIAGDSTLSPTSENWVQNKVITLKINGVESVLATVNTGTTADQAYAEGDFILIDGTNVLYKALSAIAQGASFTTGSGGNVEQTTIGAVLKYLASNLGVTSLSDLEDTNISSPQDNQPLIYDATTSKWKNDGSVLEKISNKSNVQVNSTDKYPSSALVYAMNQNLGDPSSASAVTGADAFSKIGKLSSDLASKDFLVPVTIGNDIAIKAYADSFSAGGGKINWAYYYSGNADAPSANEGYIQIIHMSSNFKTVVAFSRDGNIYVMQKSTTWKAWKTITMT